MSPGVDGFEGVFFTSCPVAASSTPSINDLWSFYQLAGLEGGGFSGPSGISLRDQAEATPALIDGLTLIQTARAQMRKLIEAEAPPGGSA